MAGICGLIFSVEPDLSRTQAVSLLEATADKIGTVPYVDGRNDYYGYGRVNAYAALLALTPSVESIVLEADGSITLSWKSVPSLNYRVLRSDDLRNWQDAGGSIPAGSGETTSWSDTGAESAEKRFYKVKLSP